MRVGAPPTGKRPGNGPQPSRVIRGTGELRPAPGQASPAATRPGTPPAPAPRQGPEPGQDVADAAKRAAFTTENVRRTALAGRRQARQRAGALRNGILFVLPLEWRTVIAPLLHELGPQELSLVLAILQLQWREGYRVGHTDGVRGTHYQPGPLKRSGGDSGAN